MSGSRPSILPPLIPQPASPILPAMTRIGIVGCGRILAAHLRGYRLLREAGYDDFQITALCARKEDDACMYVKRGEGPPQRPGVSDIPGDPLAVSDEFLSDFQPGIEVSIHTDYEDMIANGAIDAVNDFTLHSLHHRIAACAFAHQKDVLSQKPLGVTVEAARRMCDEAEARDCVLGVFENARNRPATRHWKWLFDSGLGGALQMVLFGVVGAWWAPDRIVAETPWRHRLDEGGGLSLDMGVHQFDIIRHLAGEIRSVTARTAIVEPRRATRNAAGEIIDEVQCDADDTFFASFETRSGVVGDLHASWCGHGEPTKVGQGFVFYGDKARVTGDDVTFDGTPAESLSALYEAKADEATKERDFPFGLADGFALNQYDWLRAVADRREPETSGREGLQDLAAAYAIVESARAGRTVEVDEVLSGALRDYQRPIDSRFGLSAS